MKSKLLWVDGNNVRGFGKFKWNSVELQHRLVRFCYEYRIPTAIVVWDHGSHQFACSRQYLFDNLDRESPLTMDATDNDSSDFSVNLMILFSGIRQRADNVIIEESSHLVTSTFQDGVESNVTIDWASMAFVTNDRDLNFKLRRQANSNPPSIRLNRRKRRLSDKLYENDIAKNLGDDKKSKPATNPLFCDSGGFVELLSDLPSEYCMNMNDIDMEASKSIENAKSSIRRFLQSQRRGSNPRREKTWERCVQAETYRRHLHKSLKAEIEHPSKVASSPSMEDENSIFIANYLYELQNARGYFSTIHQDENNEDNGNSRNDLDGRVSPYLGPSRLDKNQRRLLGRYNALIRNGEYS